MQTPTSALEEVNKFKLVSNVAKAKVMTVGDWKSTGTINVGLMEIEECHEFCYLGSTITNDGVVIGIFWYDWVKPTIHWTVGENLADLEDVHPCNK